ncbi:MAG: DUF1631 family protein [Pseudomonadales bacterium]|nr:DUF1631 family protein [Pseudomonadales bacterium]
MSNALPNKLQKIFEHTVALVLPSAIKAGGPVLVNLKKTEGEPVQDKRGIFIQQFKKGMAEIFAQAAKKTNAAEADTTATKRAGPREDMEERISKYSLMDKELLEAQIMIDRLCNTLQAEHQFELDCLGMRLERLAGITIERSNIPLAARQLTTVFHQSCEALQPSKFSSDAAMTNWGKALSEAYALWLKQLNQILIKQHVLPRLDMDDVHRRYEKKNQEKAREMRKNLIADVTGKSGDDTAAISDEELINSLRSLVANAVTQQPELGKHIVSGSSTGAPATREDIFEALGQITDTAQINAETGYRDLPANTMTLAEKIAAQTDMQSRTLDAQTQNAISLLSMTFDKLQQEEQIAEPIKPLINDLQVPILKMAMQDQHFFSNPDNPAQEMLNELAKAGTRWTPKPNISKDPFYKKISSIVDDISNNSETEEDSEAFFGEKLITLKDFLEREERRSALLEERIIQAESVKARTDAARDTASRIVRKKIFRHNAEPATATFLQDYWTQVLFFYINRDDDYLSDEQQQARKIIDDLLIFTPDNLDKDIAAIQEQLVWHVHHMGLQIDEQEHTLQVIHQEMEGRRQTIRNEMANAAQERAAAEAKEQAAAQAAAALKAAVDQALERGGDTTPAASVATTPDPAPAVTINTAATAFAKPDADLIVFDNTPTSPPIDSSVDATITPEESEVFLTIDDDEEDDEDYAEADIAVEDIFDKQADMLRADTWFRLTNATHDKLKIKLAAVIKHNGNYIFVNREGVKIITTQKAGVAELLRSGELSLVDDTVFFDRALESVIQSLRR